MKTINLELSKRLAHYLKNVDTEFAIFDKKEWKLKQTIWYIKTNKYTSYKTLTLEEAIEFLPNEYPWKFKDAVNYRLRIERNWEWDKWKCSYDRCEPCEDACRFEWKTLLEAIEKMLEYLLDNELLWKTAKM